MRHIWSAVLLVGVLVCAGVDAAPEALSIPTDMEMQDAIAGERLLCMTCQEWSGNCCQQPWCNVGSGPTCVYNVTTGWWDCGSGWLATGDRALERCLSATGACMNMNGSNTNCGDARVYDPWSFSAEPSAGTGLCEGAWEPGYCYADECVE